DRNSAGARGIFVLRDRPQRTAKTRMGQPVESKINDRRNRQNEKVEVALGSKLEAEDARQRNIEHSVASTRCPLRVEHEEVDDDVESKRRNCEARTRQFHDGHEKQTADRSNQTCCQKCQTKRYTEVQGQEGGEIGTDSVECPLPQRQHPRHSDEQLQAKC